MIIKTSVRIGVNGSHGVHVRNHVTKKVRLNPFETDIDAGQLMVLKIVALDPDTHITIMTKELAIQTLNVSQYVNGVIGANGVHVIPTVRKECVSRDVLIMKIRVLLVPVKVSDPSCAVITLMMSAKNVLTNMTNVTKYQQVFVLMFVIKQK